MTSLLTNNPLQPNRVDHPLNVNSTLVSHSCQVPMFLYLATHGLNSNTEVSIKRRFNEFHRLDTTNRSLKFKITADFHNLSPHPIPSHTSLKLKHLPYPFLLPMT